MLTIIINENKLFVIYKHSHAEFNTRVDNNKSKIHNFLHYKTAVHNYLEIPIEYFNKMLVNI